MRHPVVSLLSFAVLAALGASACGEESGSSGGGGGGSGGSGGGGLEGPCVPKGAECYGPAGPTGPGAECLAKHDNTSSANWQGKISQITVTKPASLATKFVQDTIIGKGISLNQPSCLERGDGTFNWLFEFDSATNKLKTGGGLPITDPAAGGCFVTLPNAAVPVAPVTIDIAVDGLAFAAEGIDLAVPIFTAVDQLDNPILLPIHGGSFSGTWSADHNCIGKYNADQFDPINNCLPDTSLEPPQQNWTDAGVLSGYITVAESDLVFIDDIGATLCTLLAGAGDWKGDDGTCKGKVGQAEWDGGNRPQGDWCASTTPGGLGTPATATCKDAYRLEATFAAAAFKINGDCD
ncbi:MAG: hypothetical protein IT376_03885 [Polyangiaceae bacterium]|nr:hypothetical protein [Polyangiaceae bacterium]